LRQVSCARRCAKLSGTGCSKSPGSHTAIFTLSKRCEIAINTLPWWRIQTGYKLLVLCNTALIISGSLTLQGTLSKGRFLVVHLVLSFGAAAVGPAHTLVVRTTDCTPPRLRANPSRLEKRTQAHCSALLMRLCTAI
ncbi:unnamed protein product, partial [Scytosiphon promiscuus]